MEAFEIYQAHYRWEIIYMLPSVRTQNERGNCALMLLRYSESGR